MKLTVLGTAAATSVPLGFCRCQTCLAARQQGGKDIRRRSSLLINNDLLIDLGGDVVIASFTFGCDLTGVRYWLQTHAHADHFDPGHLIARTADYGAQAVQPMTLYASARSVAHMSNMLDEEQEGASLSDPALLREMALSVIPAQAGKPQKLGPYTIHAIPVAHDVSVGSVIFALTDGEHAVLYATDTPDFDDAVWAALHAASLRFDAVFLDHTIGGDSDRCPGHLNAAQVRCIAARLRAEGLLAPGGTIWATHISHEWNAPHETLSRQAAPHGYQIAYDGMTLTL